MLKLLTFLKHIQSYILKFKMISSKKQFFIKFNLKLEKSKNYANLEQNKDFTLMHYNPCNRNST